MGLGFRVSVGDRVEVTMSHPDLVGSYHTARVVKVLPMHGFYRIRYDYVKAANGRTLEEVLPVLMFRPHPNKRCF